VLIVWLVWIRTLPTAEPFAAGVAPRTAGAS